MFSVMEKLDFLQGKHCLIERCLRRRFLSQQSQWMHFLCATTNLFTFLSATSLFLTHPVTPNMAKHSSHRYDPYALAHKYWEYIREKPRRKRENLNPYYEKLLAKQPDPAEEETDDRSRAIR
ncbi:hypothetical protein CC86DRAFT_438355 [Ophiobolus disseminans]|uniref:Uncharacterized protein n=1 Tax=Ophiobolus disseminans TaxID=1469910 RepID=A0A6A7A6R8_9PLEO|nr:hypothetical protein CC86DRAFT_438355 [Ophiobolus disseminans]